MKIIQESANIVSVGINPEQIVAYNRVYFFARDYIDIVYPK